MDGDQSKRIEAKILKFNLNTIFSNKYPLPWFLNYLMVKVSTMNCFKDLGKSCDSLEEVADNTVHPSSFMDKSLSGFLALKLKLPSLFTSKRIISEKKKIVIFPFPSGAQKNRTSPTCILQDNGPKTIPVI